MYMKGRVVLEKFTMLIHKRFLEAMDLLQSACPIDSQKKTHEIIFGAFRNYAEYYI